MIEHVWTVLCLHTIIDQFSNNLSIIHAIEGLTIHDEPREDGEIDLPFEAVSYWIRSEPATPELGIIRYTFSYPSGETKLISEGTIDLSEHERHRHILKIHGMRTSKPGRYYLNIEVKSPENEEWIRVSRVPLTITFKNPKDLDKNHD
jgi:hypothetical protein